MKIPTQHRTLVFRLIFAQTMDALTFAFFFLFVYNGGPITEKNPIIATLLALGGVQLVMLVKIGVASYIGWRSEHPPTAYRWWSKPITSKKYIWVETVMLSVATASGIVGAGFNLGAILYEKGVRI